MNFGIENETREFKESTSELHQAVEAIASILNKHSRGELYFGVNDDGELIGQMVKDSTVRYVTDSIIRDIEPCIIPTVEKLSSDGLDYIKVSFSGTQKPYSAFGKFLIRVGTQNRHITRDELKRIIKSEDYSYPWEKENAELKIDEIDDTSLYSYYKEAVNCGRLLMSEYNKEQLLSTLELLKNGLMNNAAYALFGRNGKISLKLATYATDEKIFFTDLKLFKGNIYNLYDTAAKYVFDHINWKMEIGLKREAIPEIPVEAIREIIVNAFAHAIYEPIPEIEINIHPGMITIFNPGSFPDDLTPLDFVNKNIPSIKRNPLILDVLYRCKNVEKSGTGFKRMNNACMDMNVRWNFISAAYGFTFIFYRNKTALNDSIISDLPGDLTKLEKDVLSMIINNNKVTREEMANKTGKNIRTIQRVTNSLAAKKKIVRIGNNQFGYWEVLK